MRLGDLDELKKCAIWTKVNNGVELIDIKVVPLDAIDNAPTVEIPCNQIIWEQGYECGKNERPQGEWIIVKDKKWGDNVKCPFCGKELAGTDLNFCCKCGADMRGKEE